MDYTIDQPGEAQRFQQKNQPKQPVWVKMRAALRSMCIDKKSVSKEDAKSFENEPVEGEPKVNIFYTKSVNEVFEDTDHCVNEYKLLKELGSGSFSTVYHGIREYTEDGEVKQQDVAVKAMHIPSLKKDKFINYTPNGTQVEVTGFEKVLMEIFLMDKIRNDNVVIIYEVIECKEHDYMYLVMEYWHFGQISDWVEKEKKYKRNQSLIDYLIESNFSGRDFTSDEDKLEQVAKVIFKDAITGLYHLHSKFIVHRDIKLDNIFFTKNGNKAKLGDFTISSQLEGPDTKLLSKAGTSLFMAPEIDPPEEEEKEMHVDLQGLMDDDFADLDVSDDDLEPKKHEFTALPTDIWSMGVSLFTYFNESLPFYAENEHLLLKKVRKDEIPPLEGYSDALNDLIAKMTKKNPEERPNAHDVLNHSWFKS